MTRMHNHIQFVQETRWIDDAEERAALIGKIDAAAGHDVDVNELTEKEERGFIDGWENEGGFMDDCVSDHPCPWCSPWYSGEGVLKLRGDTPAEWGASYFRQVKAALMAVVRQTCGCYIDEKPKTPFNDEMFEGLSQATEVARDILENSGEIERAQAGAAVLSGRVKFESDADKITDREVVLR